MAPPLEHATGGGYYDRSLHPNRGSWTSSFTKGGAAHIDGVSNVVKLSSNENPFGPSDAAKEAFRKVAFDLHRYPSTDHSALA